MTMQHQQRYIGVMEVPSQPYIEILSLTRKIASWVSLRVHIGYEAQVAVSEIEVRTSSPSKSL